MLKVFPEAGEAVIVAMPGDSVGELVDADALETPEEVDEDRAAANWRRNNRRAVATSRRYIVANRLRFMWVLTFAEGVHGAEGRARAMLEVAQFVERLREWHGKSLPYWYSPELHPGEKGGEGEPCPTPDTCSCGGHGWHVNVLIGVWVHKHQLQALWGHGNVWVSDFASPTRYKPGTPFLERLRMGARYATKYVTEDWDQVMLAGGAHRYEVAQGFQPAARVVYVRTFFHAERLAVEEFGADPVMRWTPDMLPEGEVWEGPECVVLWFGGGP